MEFHITVHVGIIELQVLLKWVDVGLIIRTATFVFKPKGCDHKANQGLELVFPSPSPP